MCFYNVKKGQIDKWWLYDIFPKKKNSMIFDFKKWSIIFELMNQLPTPPVGTAEIFLWKKLFPISIAQWAFEIEKKCYKSSVLLDEPGGLDSFLADPLFS